MFRHRRLVAACACACASLGIVTSAARADIPAGPTSDTSSGNTGALHANAGLEFKTADFFRGIRQPENSPIFQPYVDLHLNVVNQGDFHLGAYAGTRGSGAEKSHSGAPLTYYESDVLAGAEMTWQNFRVAVGYTSYHSPNGSFATVADVGARVEIDDAAWMRGAGVPLGLNPHVAVYREILDQNAGTSVRSQPGKQNTYVEVGIRPEVTCDLNVAGIKHITFGLPVTLGMSPDNYYSLTPTAKSNAFGFTNVGVAGSIPLPLPASWGQWDLHGEFDWVHDFAPGARAVNAGHKDFFYGGAGIALHY